MTTQALLEWLAGGDTGMSSKTLARECGGLKHDRISYPSDPADLGRCVRLIDAVPEARAAVDRLAAKDKYWRGLAPKWDDLTASYLAERPSGTCPKTYAAMKAILNPIEDRDRSVVRLGPGVTMRFPS